MKKLVSTLGLGVALVFVPGLSNAGTFDTTSAGPPNDGILQNFSGIDWDSNGAGYITDFGLTNANNQNDTDTFNFVYQAFAGTIQTTSLVNNLYDPTSATGTYEFTTIYHLTEQATCLNNGCSAITISTVGTWDIYFDNTPNANQSAGTGFTDGDIVLSGTWDSGTSLFGLTGAGIGNGGGKLLGKVTYTNAAYISPAFSGTDWQGSLVVPGTQEYTPPAFVDGIAVVTTPTSFVIQTDGSQNFTVPEPTSMLLLGAGMLGLGFRRKHR